MANNQVVPFEQAPVPAHITAAFPEANIVARSSVNQLSIKGKAWRIIISGNETVLQRKNADGDMEPISTVRLIVLDHNKKRSRGYYEGEYSEDENKAPTCWSSDSVTPDASVPADQKQSATCATCPNAVKGSKMTANNKPITACAPNKRLAVIPESQLDFAPLLLRLPQTSIFDKEQIEPGWFAWDQYLDFLRSKGAAHTAAIVTKVKFVASLAYPKLLFSALRWLEPDEIAKMGSRWKDDDVQALLSASPTDGVAGAPKAAADDEDEPVVPPAPVAAPAPAPVAAAKPPAVKKPKPAPVAPVAPPPAADEDDDGFAAAAAPVAATKPVAAAKVAVETGTPDALKALAAKWDD